MLKKSVFIYTEAVSGGVLENFAKFTVKHLFQSLFIKKGTLAQVLSYEFCQIFKSIFFTEHLWTAASAYFTKIVSYPIDNLSLTLFA